MPFIEQLGMQAAGNAVGGAMGLVLGGIERKNQIKQQQKLQNMQIAGQKEMGVFNQQQQMQMWRDTNYSAQMEELKKAGLNPGLLYGMGGGAGGSTQANTGSVSGGQAAAESSAAGMGISMGQAAMMAAQIENIKADTENKRATTPKIGAETEKIKADTGNVQADTALKKIDQLLKGLEWTHSAATIDDRIRGTQDAMIKIGEELEILGNNREISAATKETKISQIEQEYINMVQDNAVAIAQEDAIRKGIELTDEQMDKIEAEIDNMAGQLKNEVEKTGIQQQLANWETSHTKQLYGLAGGIIEKIVPGAKGKGPVGKNRALPEPRKPKRFTRSQMKNDILK